jgi:hypothetical protein
MTVRIHTTIPGINQSEFDAIHKALTSSGEPPMGLIFHSSAPVDGGWLIVDFWDSRQNYDAAMSLVQKAIESAGVALGGPPSVEEFPVYEILQP